MNIQSTRRPQARRRVSIEKKTPLDRGIQSGVGALVTATPALAALGGAALGEAIAGTPGRIVGGVVATLATAAGTKFGMLKFPGSDENVISRVSTQAAILTGLSATVGALGGLPGVAAAAAAGAIFSADVLDLAEANMVHAPQWASDPAPEGYKDIKLETSDGLKLDAWLSDGKKGDPVAIFFHANGTNIEDNHDRLEILRKQGFRVLAPEYRGYGEQEGIPTERGLKKDAQAAYDFAKTLTSADKITFAGQSLGGAVATNLAKDNTPAALLLESTFTSLAGASEIHMGKLAGSLVKGRYPTINTVANLDIPVFVAHSDSDYMVGDDAGKQIAAAAPNSTFFEAPGAGHMDVHRSNGYEEALGKFVKAEGLTKNP